MNFAPMMAALDTAVEEHLCDDAVLQSHDAGPMIPVRVMLSFPVDVDRLQGMSITRTRPEIRVSLATAPELREGDVIYVTGGENWQIASAPTRPGDGRWWQAEIEPLE